jgi:hypothetical protein
MDRQALYHLVTIVLQTLAGTGAMIAIAIILVGIVCGAFFVWLVVGKAKCRGD